MAGNIYQSLSIDCLTTAQISTARAAHLQNAAKTGTLFLLIQLNRMKDRYRLQARRLPSRYYTQSRLSLYPILLSPLLIVWLLEEIPLRPKPALHILMHFAALFPLDFGLPPVTVYSLSPNCCI